jgi:hypothetical protein
MLRPADDRLLERILAFGPAGTGKSTAGASIAALAQKTGSDARFHVVDTDLAWDRMLAEGYPGLANVDVHVALEWPEYREALAKIRSIVRPQDWVVVDLISNAWETVQSYFTEQVFDQDVGDYFLQVRKEMKAGSKKLETFSGWVDWSVINSLYKSWAHDLLFKTRANVLCMARMAKVSDAEDKATRVLFGPHGVKPEGQKALAYQFHSVLLMGQPRAGEWTMTTVKDRERPQLDKAPVRSFAVDYLVRVGRWRP